MQYKTMSLDLLKRIERKMGGLSVATLPFQVRCSEDKMRWIIHIVVNGFEKDELCVEKKNDVLYVSGVKKDTNSLDLNQKDTGQFFCNSAFKELEVLEKLREFSLIFYLDEHMEVSNVELKNSTLKISLQVNLPEEKKQKFEIFQEP